MIFNYRIREINYTDKFYITKHQKNIITIHLLKIL